MKFTLLATLLLVPTTLLAAAQGCIDLDSDSSVSDAGVPPTVAASKRKGQLYVKLNKATKLTDKDTFGKSDPFVEMWVDKDYKSRSGDTKGLNPVFNQTFCFYVRPGQDKLYVKAVDRDPLRNDKIGQASIPLSNVFQTGKEGPKDYKLPKWLGLSDNGSVNLQMQYQEDRT